MTIATTMSTKDQTPPTLIRTSGRAASCVLRLMGTPPSSSTCAGSARCSGRKSRCDIVRELPDAVGLVAVDGDEVFSRLHATAAELMAPRVRVKGGALRVEREDVRPIELDNPLFPVVRYS